MNRIKRIVSALLAAVLLSATTAFAATWVNVSSWAYNDVSQFTNEGLLPQCFDNVSEYRENITREQFAELVCSILVNTSRITRVHDKYTPFEDTANNAAATLFVKDVISGTRVEINAVTEQEAVWFSPLDKITRQDASVIIFNALNLYSEEHYSFSDYNELPIPEDDAITWLSTFSDDGSIADYAKEAVTVLSNMNIISGTDNNEFLPKDNITIEQAIIICHRLYRCMPLATEADGLGIAAVEETEIQRYSNGFVETKKGDVLYIKNGDDVLKEFETDIYLRIFSGGDYIAAQNINHRTEIYNALTGEFMFEIPITIYTVDDQYIYTQSKRFGRMTFGLYDYSGEEVLPTEYSLEEIEILKNNDFNQPEAVKREADGWIYYADKDKNGNLYKIDSNGENCLKLSDYNCVQIRYDDGWLYYTARTANGDSNYYRVRDTGEDEQQLEVGEYTEGIGEIAGIHLPKQEQDISWQTDNVDYIDKTETTENGVERTRIVSAELNDANFRVYQKYIEEGRKRWIYVEHNGEMKEVAYAEYGYISVDRAGDMLYYRYDNSNNSSHSIYEYDMNTGETKEIVNNVYDGGMNVFADEGFIIYKDRNSNIWRYDIDTGKCSEVYPNKGFNPYGEVLTINGGMDYGVYKIDKEGNVVDILPSPAGHWIYVKNEDK